MTTAKIQALLILVILTGVCFTLAYLFPPTTYPAPTIEVERVEPHDLSNEVEPLPTLLELVTVPEFTYSLPGDSASFIQTCSDFEVLDRVDREVFVLDHAEDNGIDSFSPCVRSEARTAGTLVTDLCGGNMPLSKAFDRAVRHFRMYCDIGVPQWDLEPATPHTEILGDWL